MRKLRIHPETNSDTRNHSVHIMGGPVCISFVSTSYARSYWSILVYQLKTCLQHNKQEISTPDTAHPRSIPLPSPLANMRLTRKAINPQAMDKTAPIFAFTGARWCKPCDPVSQTEQRNGGIVENTSNIIQHAQRSWLGVCEHRKLWRHQIHLYSSGKHPRPIDHQMGMAQKWAWTWIVPR